MVTTTPIIGIQRVEGVVLVTLLAALFFWFLIHRLAASRPGFRIGMPLGVAFGLRLAAIAGISATGLESTLRGGDENTFLFFARYLAQQPLGHGDLPHAGYQLQTVLFAMEIKLGFLTVGAMRIVQVAIALTGVILMVAAVYDLSNGRAARLAAWILAFEPASLFFNSAIHKDPNMELAAGLVVFGGTMLWRRLDVRGILVCALGGAIAVETRAYAGWFLVSAAVLLLLHAALRHMNRPLRAMPLIYAIIIGGFLVTPVLLQLSSKKSLHTLQLSQNANARGIGQGTGGPNSDNLKLEQVDFSSRGAILKNLPKRMRDLVLRPYPWQLADTSQRFGALGTLFAYAILILLARYAWLSRGHIFPWAAPFLYPLFFMLVAYSLSVGNAGTGFRYRAHLTTLAVCAMVVLREHVRRRRAETRAGIARNGRESVAAHTTVAAPV
jgi:hypothetical protein